MSRLSTPLSRVGSSSSLRSGAKAQGLATPSKGVIYNEPMPSPPQSQMDPYQSYNPDADDIIVADIIQRIQTYIFPRRLRVREFFLDFDPLRCGRVTRSQFARVMNNAKIEASEQEIIRLCDHFTDRGPRVQRPVDISYDHFCEVLDEVFQTDRLEKDPFSDVPSPGSTLRLTFVPKETDDDEQVNHLLHRLGLLCRARGVIIKNEFADFDRSSAAAMVSVNPRRAGKCTVAQFKRRFPFRKEFTEDEVNMLIQRYHTDAGDIHFMALHTDVSEALSTEPPPFPMSPFMNRPDCADWMQSQTDVVEKIQSKVVGRRIRVKDSFTDFDPLRKGVCTVGQLKTALTCLGLERDINADDFEGLVGRYTREDGMFNWMDFNRDIDTAFALPGLEKTPTKVSPMPDATSTIKARRNKMLVSDARRAKIENLEEKIRERIRVRRTYLKPTFLDMDRSHRGLITRSQFARCMAMLQFELDETAVALLASLYCDRGNHNDFNYVDFCKSVDPPNEEQATANAQINAPYIPFVPNKYFDARGKVHKLTQSAIA